jgi:zinc D-Ala-D-Ala carboxypeptidase
VKHFSESEFDCKHTGENRMDPAFLRKIDCLRDICGFPFRITSGYRDPSHPSEVGKEKPGYHCKGIAADIYCIDARNRRAIIWTALDLGFTGIGVAKDFIHVDTRPTEGLIWTY